VKYQRSESFVADYARLGPRERELFKDAVRAMNAAYARGMGWPPDWPRALRISRLRGQSSIWEMTWSFARPDGRATFELVEVDAEPAVRWRRICDHRVFDEP
jgi:hypothetical protein